MKGLKQSIFLVVLVVGGLIMPTPKVHAYYHYSKQEPSAHESYEHDSSFEEDGDTIVHKLHDGSMRVALDDFEGAAFWYPNYFSDVTFYKNGQLVDDDKPILMNGLYQSRLRGPKLKPTQITLVYNNGSNSYWSPNLTYYPGTLGYQQNEDYYDDGDNSSWTFYLESRSKVVFDNAHVVDANTKKLFQNQDMAYEQSELQPRIFLVSVDNDNFDTITKDAKTAMSQAPFSAYELNKAGMLIYLFRDYNYGVDSLYDVRVIVSEHLRPYISQTMVNNSIKPYQNQLKSGNKVVLNQGIVKVNAVLTKLIWQRYLKPNLTNVDTYTHGKKLSVAAFSKDSTLNDLDTTQYNDNVNGTDTQPASYVKYNPSLLMLVRKSDAVQFEIIFLSIVLLVWLRPWLFVKWLFKILIVNPRQKRLDNLAKRKKYESSKINQLLNDQDDKDNHHLS